MGRRPATTPADDAGRMSIEPRLSGRGLVKTFGTTTALAGVDVDPRGR